jgi:Rrf2 family protein
MRLELTRSTDYAVRAMLALTRHPGETLSSSDIASVTNIPVRFVTQVMAHLVRAGLVRAVIGRAGGYRLAQPAEAVSILAIVQAVEGDSRRQQCALSGAPCQTGAPCAVHPVLSSAKDAFLAQLARASLAEVAASSRGSGTDPAGDPPPATPAFRRVRPSDQAALVDFYAGLSPDSRYARFLGFTSGVGESASRSFCTPDHTHDEGFVADLGGRIVGHLCLEPAGPRRLELAVAVSDDMQGRGVGRGLLEAALEWARQRRFEAILATAYADNFRVLRLLTSAPFPVHVTPADGGVVDIVMPLVEKLLPDKPIVVPPALSASNRRAGRRRAVGPSRCSRVVWRGTRRPARGAEGSASRGSS